MPGSPALICPYPGCSELSRDGKKGCPQHRPKYTWVHRSKYSESPERITGPRLQKLRHRLFERAPLCAMCGAEGHVTIATIRDHVKPLAEGGLDVESNTQPLCEECHAVKTHEESLRGATERNTKC